MPDPSTLKVGDRVRFVAIPDEWSDPNHYIPEEDRTFMEELIKRRSPRRVYEIDEYGHPWIMARLKDEGPNRLHTWAIFESTGWKRVKSRNDRRS